MGRNKCLIFFSWQSDIPECRKFIQKALTKFRNKATELGLDSIEIDRDTRNVPGSPDIPDTIFEKIKRCDIFVADVTIINRDLVPEESSHRLTPNPNVGLEQVANWKGTMPSILTFGGVPSVRMGEESTDAIIRCLFDSCQSSRLIAYCDSLGTVERISVNNKVFDFIYHKDRSKLDILYKK